MKYILTIVIFLTIPMSIAAAPGQRGLKPITLSHGLSDLLVNVIYQDSEDFVWFGTESSLDRFDGNKIVRYSIDGDKRRSRRVRAIAESSDGVDHLRRLLLSRSPHEAKESTAT